MTPRIAPMAPTGHDDDVQALLDLAAAGTGGAQNIFLTFARHPGLFRKYMPYGGKLLAAGKLAPRDRELVILRTAYRCGSEYEWGQHVRIGRSTGITDDELRAVIVGPDDPGWSDADAALLRATDQLVATHDLDDTAWSALAARYDEVELIELTLLVGNYAMLAGMLNAVRVEREDGLASFADFSS